MRAVNLIPSEQRAGSGSLTGRSNGAALILIGLVLGVAVLAVLYGTAARQISSEQGETARLEAQTSAVQARIGRLTPFTSFVSMAEQRTKTVAQLVQARFDWSHALRELGRVLPGGVSLSTFHGQVGGSSGPGAAAAPPSTPAASGPAGAAGATPSSSTPPGSVPSMALTGCAGSQSEVAQTLQRLRLMDGAPEAQLLSSTKSGSSGGSGASAAGAGSGSCTGTAFSVQVSFAPLPATPIPTVAPAPTTPASTGASAPSRAPAAASAPPAAGARQPSASTARAKQAGASTQTIANRKGAGR